MGTVKALDILPARPAQSARRFRSALYLHNPIQNLPFNSFLKSVSPCALSQPRHPFDMKLFAAFALLAGHFTFGALSPPASTATSIDIFEPLHNDTHVAVLPILDIGTSYILGQSQNNLSTGLTPADDPGPIQCGPDKECLDSSCCNSDGKCGFQEVHCRPKEPKKCISNCDAKVNQHFHLPIISTN